MKKILTTSLIAFTLCISLLTPTKTKAQAIEQGNVIIDAFYGWPDLITAMIGKTYKDNAKALGLSIGTLGPIGGRGEYLLSDKIGIGLDFSHTATNFRWEEDSLGKMYEYRAAITRTRFLPRINIHFSDNDKLDFYSAFGVGFVNYKLIFESNNPIVKDESVSQVFPPITVRIAIGIRYFITENIGLSMEFGQLGPLATAGVSAKF